MKRLYEKYAKLSNSYFGEAIEVENLFDKTNAKDECLQFIKENLKKGRKGSELWGPFDELYQDNGKHEHTVSLYLLGLLMRQSVSIQLLHNKIIELINQKEFWYDSLSEHDYDYTWILTCLYHDATSCIENKGRHYSIKKFKLTIFNYNEKQNGLTRFSQDLVERYFIYRKKVKETEHGSYGGYFFFRKACDSFKKNTKTHNWNECLEKRIGNISYRKEHLDHFAYIADAIICHNIWMAYDEKTKEIYRKNKLKELIIDSADDRLKLDEYPLQFILCLLDTIEPIKRFQSLDAKTILENVFVKIEENGIKIGCSSVIKEQPEFHQWFGNIHELEKWMAVTVSPCKCDGEMCCKKITWNLEEVS